MADINYDILQKYGWSPWDAGSEAPAGYTKKFANGIWTIMPIAGYASVVPQTISQYNNTLSDADYAKRNATVLNDYYKAINPQFATVDPNYLASMSRPEMEAYVGNYIKNAQAAIDLQNKQKSGGFFGGLGDMLTDPGTLLSIGTFLTTGQWIPPNVTSPAMQGDWESALTNAAITGAGMALTGGLGGAMGTLGGEAISMGEAISAGANVGELLEMGFSYPAIMAQYGGSTAMGALKGGLNGGPMGALTGGLGGGVNTLTGSSFLGNLATGGLNALIGSGGTTPQGGIPTPQGTSTTPQMPQQPTLNYMARMMREDTPAQKSIFSSPFLKTDWEYQE